MDANHTRRVNFNFFTFYIVHFFYKSAFRSKRSYRLVKEHLTPTLSEFEILNDASSIRNYDFCRNYILIMNLIVI